MKTPLYLLLSAILVSNVFAKRSAPADVPSVVVGHERISAPHFTEIGGVPVRGGVLESRDSETGKVVWSVRIYKTDYDPNLEGDVQDVFIKTLSHDAVHGLLIMSDEKGRVFVLDLQSRQVTPIVRGKSDQKEATPGKATGP